MKSGHYVAIFGGAVAGSEAAFQLTQKGVKVVVFEQNALPYGKIESGLPKWHHKLRDRQEKIIDEKLSHKDVKYVPLTKVGRDVDLQSVVADYNFSAVLLATGAWRDRPQAIEGINEYVNKGLLYQNPLVAWFNNNHDPNYKGEQVEIPDNTLVIGGGLASVDVIKIVVIETVRAALKKRAIEIDALTLERKGVAKALEEMNLSMEKLGLKGPRLVIRNRVHEMSLTTLPDNPSEADIEKASQVRRKLVAILQEKFPFRLIENRMAVDKVVENGRLTGLVFREVHLQEDGSYAEVEGSEETIKAPLVISAIGSIPEPIPGIRMKGDIYRVVDSQSGQIEGFDKVFALGNAVTGRGNIRQSQVHSRRVSESIVDDYMVWDEEDYDEIFEFAENVTDRKVDSLVDRLQRIKPLSPEQVRGIDEKVTALQKKVGYEGDYAKWVKKHLPTRLEDMAGH